MSGLTLFGAATAITLGVIIPQKLDQGVSIGVTLAIADILFECSIGIYQALYQYSQPMAILLCAPVIIIGALAVFEWWRSPLV